MNQSCFLLLLLAALGVSAAPLWEECHAELLGYLPESYQFGYLIANPVLPTLWLGNNCAALHAAFHANASIQTVLSLAREFDTRPAPLASDIAFHPLGLWDDANTGDAEILETLTRAAAVINSGLQAGHSVLVYCQMGISRSTSAVLAYLLMYERTRFPDYEAALAFVRSARRVARPNPHFERVLRRLATTRAEL